MNDLILKMEMELFLFPGFGSFVFLLSTGIHGKCSEDSNIKTKLR